MTSRPRARIRKAVLETAPRRWLFNPSCANAEADLANRAEIISMLGDVQSRLLALEAGQGHVVQETRTRAFETGSQISAMRDESRNSMSVIRGELRQIPWLQRIRCEAVTWRREHSDRQAASLRRAVGW